MRKWKAIDEANLIVEQVFMLGVENSELEDRAAAEFSELINAKNLTVSQISSIANIMEMSYGIGLSRNDIP